MKYLDLITKLVSIKRIIAFMLTSVFCYMAIVGEIKSTEYITIFATVIAFYFGQSLASRSNNKQGLGE
ncbi:hypothetical protein EHZ12_06025 [Clostridium perfringens]|uniref:hypothetical protein n=1 Tax=Clostridium perfringens TaxID=1502 RepID=UPI000F53D948|nr:hypothetical protein [Clostridium perfringens]MDK3222208.1 hypothetical protein [Clostridium perfringens]RQN19158.1 hypothetical protein EHZ12_06025 [Clostridium perfringens]